MTSAWTAWVSALWLAAALLPLAWAGGLLAARGSARLARALLTWSPAAVLPVAALAILGARDPAATSATAPWLLLGVEVGVDVVAWPLLVTAAVLYGLALVHVAASRSKTGPVLAAVLLVCFVGNAGVFAAADAVTFYLCFALMSFSAYLLVVHARTPEALRAGRVYLVMAVLGEGAILSALMLVVDAGGLLLADAPAAVASSPHRDWIIALLLAGFGVKVGTAGLHVWLPLAHPAAPAPASAVLSGLMLKAGLVGWLRFLPLGEVETQAWGAVVVAVALLGVILAAPIGALQRDAKVVLAYSSISNMGFIAVLVGMAMAQPEMAEALTLAAVLFAVHHGLAKGALFLAVPLWKDHGGGGARSILLAGLAVAAASIAGAPLTSGYLAKYAAKDAIAAASGVGAGLADWLPWVGTVSTVLLARGAWVLLTTAPSSPARPAGPALWWWLALVLATPVAALGLALGWRGRIGVPDLLDGAIWWDQTWPVLAGAVIATVAWQLSRREAIPQWAAHPDGATVPPGDLIVVEEAALRRLAAVVSRAADRVGSAQRRLARAVRRIPAPVGAITAMETRLAPWPASGAALLAVGALVVALLWGGQR